jgi:LacI family transcriptional regulator
MPSRATLKQVAERAGVHSGTASRALSEATRHMVRPDTVRRILAASEELGYHPDLTARTLRTGRTATVGVLIPDFTNPLFPPIVRGIEDALADCGYTPLLANTDNDKDREARVFRALRARQVDGFILLTARNNDPTLHELIDEQIPVVTVNRVASGRVVSSVSADDQAGISAVVDHLVNIGHRTIATIAGPRWLSTGRNRRREFERSMTRHGLNPDRVVAARAFSEDEGDRCMAELIADTDVTAVVAANDSLALGAMAALRRAGKRCPRDVSLTGFNDGHFMDKLSPSLTTVRIPQVQMGCDAARILLGQMLGTATSIEHKVVPTELVIRESTAAPKASSVKPRADLR